MDTSPLASYLKARQGQYLRPDSVALLKQLEREYMELESLEKSYIERRETVESLTQKMSRSFEGLSIKDAEAAMEECQRIKLVIPLARKQRKALFKNKIYPVMRPILDNVIMVAESFSAKDPESIQFYQELQRRSIELDSGKIIASPQYWMAGLLKIR